MKCDAPGEGFGGLTEQVGGCASQHQESGRRPGSVSEYAKQREHFGKSLDLVQDHESPQRPQLESGIGQPGEVGRILEVEPCRRTAARRHQLPGQSGLSHLPGAEKGHDRKLPEQQSHTVQMAGSRYIHSIEM